MIKVIIQKDLFDHPDLVRIFVIEEKDGARYVVTMDKETNLLNLERRDREEALKPCPPFMSIPVDFFDELVKGIISYANVKGLKTESESVLEGKLIATEKHLEDMRRISLKEIPKLK